MEQVLSTASISKASSEAVTMKEYGLGKIRLANMGTSFSIVSFPTFAIEDSTRGQKGNIDYLGPEVGKSVIFLASFVKDGMWLRKEVRW